MRWNAKAFELWEVFIYQIMPILIRPGDEGGCRGRCSGRLTTSPTQVRQKKEVRSEGGIDPVIENVEKEITMRKEDVRICC